MSKLLTVKGGFVAQILNVFKPIAIIKDVTKSLLQARANVNAQAEDGSTTLSLVEYQDNAGTVKILKQFLTQ